MASTRFQSTHRNLFDFDTYHASVLLGGMGLCASPIASVLDFVFYKIGFPRTGSASLLEHFCNSEADKRYQLADWRMRFAEQHILAPVVTVAELQHHPRILGTFHQLRQNITTSAGSLNLDPNAGWAVFVNRAVYRFNLWANSAYLGTRVENR
jgi:hypothetical protein